MGVFNLRIDNNNRDQRYKTFKQRPRLEVRKHSLFYPMSDPWNSLPHQVVTDGMNIREKVGKTSGKKFTIICLQV